MCVLEFLSCSAGLRALVAREARRGPWNRLQYENQFPSSPTLTVESWPSGRRLNTGKSSSKPRSSMSSLSSWISAVGGASGVGPSHSIVIRHLRGGTHWQRSSHCMQKALHLPSIYQQPDSTADIVSNPHQLSLQMNPSRRHGWHAPPSCREHIHLPALQSH